MELNTKYGKGHEQLFYKKENGNGFPAIVRHFRKVEPQGGLSDCSLFLCVQEGSWAQNCIVYTGDNRISFSEESLLLIRCVEMKETIWGNHQCLHRPVQSRRSSDSEGEQALTVAR